MAVTAPPATRPRWPDELDRPDRWWIDYDGVADELVLYFAGVPVDSSSVPIDGPYDAHPAVLIGLGADEDDTGKIVGIHVCPLRGAVAFRADWSALAEPNPSLETVARFVAEVRELFERYWTPAPPTEEQLAHLKRSDG